MADTVRVVAALKAQEGKGGEVLAMWPALAEQVRAEEGCLAYDLHRVAGDAGPLRGPGALGVGRRAGHARQERPHARVRQGRRRAVRGAAEVTVVEDDPAV